MPAAPAGSHLHRFLGALVGGAGAGAIHLAGGAGHLHEVENTAGTAQVGAPYGDTMHSSSSPPAPPAGAQLTASRSAQICSSVRPRVSGTQWVHTSPTAMHAHKPISVFCTPWRYASSPNPNAPTMAPALPDAADRPWQVARYLVG